MVGGVLVYSMIQTLDAHRFYKQIGETRHVWNCAERWVMTERQAFYSLLSWPRHSKYF